MLLVATFGCSRNNVKIEGLVQGGGGSLVTFERLDVNQTTVIDSLKLEKRGTFSVATQLEEPELYILKNSRGDIINLLLSPGDHVTVTTTSESFGEGYQVEGSSESENIRLLVEQLAGTRSKLDSLLNVADSIEDPSDPRMDLLRTAYAQTVVKQKRFTIRYLVEHFKSLSSVYALYQKFDDDTPILGEQSDLQYYIALADSLETVFPQSSLTKSLRADIERRKVEFDRTIKLNTLLSMADESSLLDLTIPDREGNEVTLSSLRGKAILLVFWASGNASSVQTLLSLRSTYDRYRESGFEIYAISLDNNKINWMNAIDFNEFNWINVSELSYPDSRANQLYNVTALPSSYLINKESEIVAKNLFGRNLETWLDNLL